MKIVVFKRASTKLNYKMVFLSCKLINTYRVYRFRSVYNDNISKTGCRNVENGLGNKQINKNVAQKWDTALD